MLQARAVQAVRAGRLLGRRPGRRILGEGFFPAFAGADDGGSGVHPHAVPKGVIGVIVRVEDVANGLVRGLADIGQDRARAPWIIGVDRQDVVAEYDPAGIGDDIVFAVGGPVVDTRRKLLDEVRLAGGVAQEGADYQDGEGGGKREAFHSDGILPCGYNSSHVSYRKNGAGDRRIERSRPGHGSASGGGWRGGRGELSRAGGRRRRGRRRDPGGWRKGHHDPGSRRRPGTSPGHDGAHRKGIGPGGYPDQQRRRDEARRYRRL